MGLIPPDETGNLKNKLKNQRMILKSN
uniref:Uncharacterized protein n=1 Tax=Anguilla anguilla TaxID=7936 RepID=A0A0E9XAY5_ANGAN